MLGLLFVALVVAFGVVYLVCALIIGGTSADLPHEVQGHTTRDERKMRPKDPPDPLGPKYRPGS